MPSLSLLIKPVSGSCNLRCSYCFYREEAQLRGTENYGLMTDDVMETLIRRAYRYADQGVSFAFQGGEPTLAGAEFFRKFTETARQYNSASVPTSYAVQTNGYDLSDELIRVFAENRFLAGVSLDGTEALHDKYRGGGSFRRVEENIRRLTEAGVPVNVLCVATSDAARQGKQLYRALRKYEYIQFIPCLPPLSGDGPDFSPSSEEYAAFLTDTFREYWKDLKQGRPVVIRHFDNFFQAASGGMPEDCAMRGECGTYYLIEADGSVYPCDFYALDEYKLGNIRDLPFNRLEKSPILAQFRQESFLLDQLVQILVSCENPAQMKGVASIVH